MRTVICPIDISLYITVNGGQLSPRSRWPRPSEFLPYLLLFFGPLEDREGMGFRIEDVFVKRPGVIVDK